MFSIGTSVHDKSAPVAIGFSFQPVLTRYRELMKSVAQTFTLIELGNLYAVRRALMT